MTVPTIKQLTDELVARVQQVAELSSSSFSVFNVDELYDLSSVVPFPLAGISWEGTIQQDNISGQRKLTSASFVTVYFMVTVAVNYKSGTGDDNKGVATDLLDGVRSAVLGYSGVNSRPWRLSGEQPLETDLEGVIFYGQMWETDLPVIGIQ